MLKEKFLQFFKLQFLMNVVLVVIFLWFVKFDNSYFFMLIPPLQVMTKQMDFLCVIEDINVRNLSKVVVTSLYSIALMVIFFVVDAPPSLIYIFILVVVQQLLGISIKVKLLDLRLIGFDKVTDFSLFAKAVKVGILPLMSILLITSNYRIDIFILKSMVDFGDIGIYSLAVNLGGQLWLIPDAFKDVLFNKNARKNDVEAIVMAIKFNLVISLMMFAFFAVFGQPIIRLLYATEFERAYMPLVIIITGNIFMIFYKFIYTLFISDGKRLISVIIFTVSVLANVVLNLVLIPDYNINGAAFASLVSYSLCGILFFIVFSRSYKVPPLRSILVSYGDLKSYALLVKEKVRRRHG